jgi:hypothetical protein
MDFAQSTTGDIKQYIKSLCTPSRIYLVLSLVLIGLSLFSHLSIMNLLICLFWTIIWTFVINYICVSGYTNVAWGISGLIGISQIVAIITIFCELVKQLVKKL